MRFLTMQGKPVKPTNWREIVATRLNGTPIPAAKYDAGGTNKVGDTRQPFRGETPDNPFGRSTVRYGASAAYGADGAGIEILKWHMEWLVEALRVLKPGAYLLAFSGSRTSHWLGAAAELVGFEIRDEIQWWYGCLSEDSDILTEGGWKRGVDVAVGERVAAWDAATGQITLAPVTAKTVAPFTGQLTRFVNDDTDQLLTPNHRVYLRNKDRRQCNGVRRETWRVSWEVENASVVSRSYPIQLPLGGVHDGEGIGGADFAALLGWIWTEGSLDRTGHGVRIYQTDANTDHVDEIAALVDRVIGSSAKSYVRTRPYPKCIANNAVRKTGNFTERTWFFTGHVAERVRQHLPQKRPTWPLLWKMTQAEKRAFLVAAMKGDGARDPCAFAFYQKDSHEWFQALLHLCGMSGRINLKKGAVSGRRSNATMLQGRHLKVASQHYVGRVWCVQVSTGAFVARRNGKVFITGNSGFPKSKKIDRAIDMEVCEQPGRHYEFNLPEGKKALPGDHRCQAEPWIEETYGGYGTGIKPAFEPVVVARKPLDGTLAGNAMQYGTGGLNIGGCRLGVAANDPSRARQSWSADRGTDGASTPGFEGGFSRGGEQNDLGRWPSNVIIDPIIARVLDAQSGVLRSGANPTRRGPAKFKNTYGKFDGQEECEAPRGEDKGGASRFFYQAKPRRKERDFGVEHFTAKSGGEATMREDDSLGVENPRAGAGRTGGGARTLDPTKQVLYPSAAWVYAVLSRKLPAATVRSLRRVTVGSTIRFNDGSVWSTCWCGSPSTDPCRQSIRSIIETESSSTIDRATWSVSPRLHTNGCMADAFGVAGVGGNLVGFAGSASPSTKPTGT